LIINPATMLFSRLQQLDEYLQTISFTSFFMDDEDLDSFSEKPTKDSSAPSAGPSNKIKAQTQTQTKAKAKKVTAAEGIRLSIVIFCMLLICYIIGYFQLSMLYAFVLILLCVLGSESRKEERNKRREHLFVADILHEEKHLRSLTELPNWVAFPQLENARW
jgi:hypothetical protein